MADPPPPPSPSDAKAMIDSLQMNIARTNRYIAEINYKNNNIKSILCESVTLPENTISTVEYQIDNRPQFLIPYTRSYGNNTISISIRENTANGKPEVLIFLDKWLNDIIKKDVTNKNYTVNYYNTFIGQMNFKALDLNNTQLFKFAIYNIYPTSVKTSSFDYSESNSYVKIELTLAFEEFEISA